MPVPSTSGTQIQKVQEAKGHIDRQLHELAAEMAQGEFVKTPSARKPRGW